MPPDVVLGASHTDLIHQFLALRAFAADSIQAGDFPFWNPYTYAGQPFLGGFQSALLYPPNVAFLALPLDRAVNFTIILHLIIVGWGMSYWASRRGVHPAAAISVGGVLALSGPVLPHVYAGHLSNLCTLAWVPWAFAGLEDWWLNRHPRGLLVASAAMGLQILAGQMQYVFFFGVAALLYALAISATDSQARRRALPALVGCAVFGAALAAVQLIPGLAAAGESIRSGKLDYNFASVFALPPENALTAIAPSFFGTAGGSPWYWGRCYPWEMSVFVGVSTAMFAVHGLFDRRAPHAARRELAVAVLLVLLALGSFLPTYRLLYDYVPGFGQFRGMSKFTFPAVLFFLLIAARGIDALIRAQPMPRWVGWFALILGVATAAGGVFCRAVPGSFLSAFQSIRANPENDFPAERFAAPDFAALAAQNAGSSLLFAAAAALAIGLCFLLAHRRRLFRWAALAILPAELVAFAATQIETTATSATMPADLKRFVAKNQGDYRVLNFLRPNNGYLLGAPDLWGNDPFVLKRYAEFMTFTQDGDLDAVQQNLAFRRVHPLYAMLRCRYLFYLSKENNSVAEYPNALPRAVLISDYRVRASRAEILRELLRPEFDPARTVILETEPTPRPEPSQEPGAVRMMDSTSDSLTLEIDTPQPAILLVTDLFSRGWRIRSSPNSVQSSYQIMPANYTLRAVPLSAGRHRFRMEYIPPGFSAGATISAIAGLTWVVALLAAARRWRETSSHCNDDFAPNLATVKSGP